MVLDTRLPELSVIEDVDMLCDRLSEELINECTWNAKISAGFDPERACPSCNGPIETGTLIEICIKCRQKEKIDYLNERLRDLQRTYEPEIRSETIMGDTEEDQLRRLVQSCVNEEPPYDVAISYWGGIDAAIRDQLDTDIRTALERFINAPADQQTRREISEETFKVVQHYYRTGMLRLP